jgi:single-strand DNA-binding protein
METLGVHKGMTLYVEGSLTNRSWTDQTTGQKRYSTEVNLDTFQLLTPRGQNGGNFQGGNSYNQSSNYNQASAPTYDAPAPEGVDDDLPF